MINTVIIIMNVIGLIPLTMYLFLKNKLHKEIQYIVPFIVLIAFASLYETIGTMMLKLNSEIWFRIYSFLEFITLLYFFKNSVKKKYPWLLIASILIYCSFFIGFLFYWNIIKALIIESYISIIETVIIYFYAILWIKELFENYEKKSILDYASFYFITGILIYLSGILVPFILSTSIIVSKELQLHNYWILVIFFNYLLRIIFLVGLWKARKQ